MARPKLTLVHLKDKSSGETDHSREESPRNLPLAVQGAARIRLDTAG